MTNTRNTRTNRLIAAVGVAAAPALMLIASSWTAAPAFAVCNEGTPNCQQVDFGHQRAQDQINDALLSGQCAGPDGFCDDSIPGSDVKPQQGAPKPPTKTAVHTPVTTSVRK
ncbi:hypothetical protein [Mycolicibacterium sp. lyk4-40-TYG-92]|uniref:hypothetical protein n=1 Tax=Mycolicibacterium sp. lyk4-40-TYG-92 TaxID=3040295 RepID=UPI00254B47DF|nr:hypothetical protein [Mycolicibacterium sp. lyk4-40-TYG-92]